MPDDLEKKLVRCREELEMAREKLKMKENDRLRQLRLENERLRDMNQSKDDFIRITNHELRTPLDIIRGNLDMVLKGETGEISEKTKEYLEDMLAGADRLSKLANDMLDMSRIETGHMKFQLTAVDVAKFLKKIEEEFTSIAQAKHITFSVNFPPNIPNVFSDPDRMYQMIDNLIGNSLKFTPRGGSIKVVGAENQDWIVISVKDTGIGIRPEDQSKLFKKFPQIDKSMIDAPKGTGLGLNLVWQVTKTLGGRAWAESPGPGKGATFSFELPKADTGLAKSVKKLHEHFLEDEISDSHHLND